MKKRWVFAILLIVMLGVNVLLYSKLPDAIPSHWNINGQIDSYQGKWFVFFPIGVYLFFALLFPLLRHFDPRKDHYLRFQKVYDSFMIALFLFLFGMWLITMIACFCPSMVDIRLLMLLATSILFIVIGNLMPKMKSNFFMGIRTPWTLSNETVWFLTHRMAGWLWFIGGFLLLPAIFLQSNASFLYLMVLVMILAIVPCAYSYVIFQKMTHSKMNEKGKKS